MCVGLALVAIQAVDWEGPGAGWRSPGCARPLGSRCGLWGGDGRLQWGLVSPGHPARPPFPLCSRARGKTPLGGGRGGS